MKKIISLLSETDIAYFAGIFDGEGTIYLQHRIDAPVSYRGGTRIRGNYTRLWIAIANTDIRLMKWLVSTFGGTIGNGRHRYGPNQKYQYRWTLSTRDAIDLLRRARCFLKVKGEETDLFLEMSGLIRSKTTGRGRLLSEEDHARRKDVFGRFRVLRDSIRSGGFNS